MVPLDSDFAVPRATATLKGLLRQLQAAGMQGAVGLGMLSMLGFDSTCQHLKVSRALLVQPFDSDAGSFSAHSLTGLKPLCLPRCIFCLPHRTRASTWGASTSSSATG